MNVNIKVSLNLFTFAVRDLLRSKVIVNMKNAKELSFYPHI